MDFQSIVVELQYLLWIKSDQSFKTTIPYQGEPI